MLRNYKELKVWGKEEVGEVERMLQALIKSLENKPLKP